MKFLLIFGILLVLATMSSADYVLQEGMYNGQVHQVVTDGELIVTVVHYSPSGIIPACFDKFQNRWWEASSNAP